MNDDYFFCFGCGAKGDLIDFVARLFDLSNYEAAQKLVTDFRLDPKPPNAAAMVKPKHPHIRQFRKDEMLCFRVLTDYLHLLEEWKVRYAPKTPEDEWDDRFVEACQMLDHIEHLADFNGWFFGGESCCGRRVKEGGQNRLPSGLCGTKKGGGIPWRRTGKCLI